MAAPTIPASGRCPGAAQYPTANCWEGNNGRKAVVIHIAQGGYLSSVRYMAAHGTSSHLINSLGGAVAQMVSLDDSAWANGLSYDDGHWICPHKKLVVPSWGLLQPGDPNPNTTTISIENEGFSGDAQPAAQRATLERELEELARRFPTLNPYVVGKTLIRHAHLDPIDKAFCCGTGIDLEGIAAAVNARLAVNGPQTWMQAWAARGVALPPEQVGWAIPQCYRMHAGELGACIRAEEYLIANELSIAVFERGDIAYVRRTNRATHRLFGATITGA